MIDPFGSRFDRDDESCEKGNQGNPPNLWFDRHPYLTLGLLLAGAALLLWFLFLRRRSGAPPASQPKPRILVSDWSPLP